jgi:hypothetical protein
MTKMLYVVEMENGHLLKTKKGTVAAFDEKNANMVVLFNPAWIKKPLCRGEEKA